MVIENEENIQQLTEQISEQVNKEVNIISEIVGFNDEIMNDDWGSMNEAQMSLLYECFKNEWESDDSDSSYARPSTNTNI